MYLFSFTYILHACVIVLTLVHFLLSFVHFHYQAHSCQTPFPIWPYLKLQQHSHVACQDDEVVHIDDDNHNVGARLHNIQGVIHMTPNKALLDKECMNALIPSS